MAQESSQAQSAPVNAPLHLSHIEGMRALAAYVVFINHAYAQVWNPFWGHYPPPQLSLATYSLVAGHLSVTVFIVISGFCLMLPVVRAGGQLRGGTASFFKRRARRILPPYYGALALCLLGIWTIIGQPTGSLWDEPIEGKRNAVAIISHFLVLQDFFGTSKINYVFWSIAVEWQIYFLFPTFIGSWRRLGPGLTLVLALVVGYALRFEFADTRLARACPHYLGMFVLGMTAAHLVHGGDARAARLRDRVPWGWIAAACFALVAGLTVSWGWQVAQARFHVIDLPIGLAAASVLVLTSRSNDGWLRRILSFGPIVFIGTFSYSVYLIHAPLLQVLWQYALAPAHLAPVTMFAALMLPGALLVLLGSYGFFRVFEEPFIKARPKTAERPAGVVPSRSPVIGDGRAE